MYTINIFSIIYFIRNCVKNSKHTYIFNYSHVSGLSVSGLCKTKKFDETRIQIIQPFNQYKRSNTTENPIKYTCVLLSHVVVTAIVPLTTTHKSQGGDSNSQAIPSPWCNKKKKKNTGCNLAVAV